MTTLGSSFNYVATAQKPTNVTHSLVASFTSPDALNLIVARCTRIEIYALEAQGLVLLHDVPLYCRVATMELWKPGNRATEQIFISTERYQFCILSYDAQRKEIVTEAKGDVADRIGRASEVGQICVMEPNMKLIGLHLYDGLFKVIPAGAGGSLMTESFNIRLEELKVIDLCFLRGLPKSTLVMLFEDNKEGRHLKTYEVNLREKDLVEGPWAQANVEAGASRLIPIKTGGVIVLGETSITYLSGHDFKAIAVPFMLVRTCEPIDDTRFLLGDDRGGLHVLMLEMTAEPAGGSVMGLVLERMGTTSVPTTLSYLTDGIAFIGSSFGDSQLVQLQTQPDEDGQYLTELERWANIGPIVDFLVVDLERHGQGSLVTCSGAGKDGSLRIVRNGIGINEQARIELPGIKGLWSVRSGEQVYLVLAFISETRILAREGEELGEAELEGFDADRATVCCVSLPNGTDVCQVTTRGVRLIRGPDMVLADEWTPPNGGAVSMAAAEKGMVLLATGGSTLHLLEAGADGKWRVLTSATMEHEVACLTICSAHQPDGAAGAMQTDDAPSPMVIPPIAACGLWTDLSIRLLALPDLKPLHTESIGGVVIPRSLAFAPFGGRIQLFCALGDGQLMSYTLVEGGGSGGGGGDVATDISDVPMSDAGAAASGGGGAGGYSLTDRKVVTIGTKPISLTPFTSHGALHVFAASDRPTVLHAASDAAKMLFSNVNLKDATHMTPFACDPAVPDTLAIASEDALILGTVDEVRKLHVRSVYLHEQPRRIAHLDAIHAFALLTAICEYTESEEIERSFVRLLDESTFEKAASYELRPMEHACSILTLRVPPAAGAADVPTLSTSPPLLLVVGTAFNRPDEPEPIAGRLLVFDVSDRTLELVCEHRIRGAAYCLEAFGAHGLLAGVNNKLQLYEWQPSAAGSTPSLKLRSEHCGHILVLYIAVRGDFILVGDLMKSLSLFQCSQTSAGPILELARDYSSHWMTSVAFLDDDHYLGAENSLNLFVARKNADATTDDDRGRLEIVGEFGLGEFVNRFRKGSLAMQVADTAGGGGGNTPMPMLLYGTVNGVIGLIASMPQEDFQFWMKVQGQLTKVIQGVGGFSHAAWRAFSNDRKTVDCSGFVDGDLIESFLSLSPSEMAQVCDGLPGVGVDELIKKVEDLTRLH